MLYPCTPGLPPQADANDGPVLEHVEFVAPSALALRIVGVESLVADQARIGDAVLNRIIEGIATHRLPGELAPHPEPAHVAAHEQLMAGRDRQPDPSSVPPSICETPDWILRGLCHG